MELYAEMLAQYLSHERMQVVFPDLKLNAAQIIEMESYRILQAIKSVLEDDTPDDPACFERIEKIVALFESYGLRCGNRHDFG